MKVPKHVHDKSFFHPDTSELICWCKYPFCKDIAQFKMRTDASVLMTYFYMMIQMIKRTRGESRIIPLDKFLKEVKDNA